MKRYLYILILITAVGCNKNDNEPKFITTISLELLEIIEPPEAPAVFTNGLIEPKVLIKNTNITPLDSISIQYYVVVNEGSLAVYSPLIMLEQELYPGEEMVVVLDKLDSTDINMPIPNGTHELVVNILGAGSWYPVPYGNLTKKILFRLEQ